MRYSLFVPAQAVGASLVYFDIFNPAAGYGVVVEEVVPMVSGAVAVTGVVAVDLFLTRTTTVGTGGTAATFEGTSLTAMTFTAVDNSQSISPSQISARLTPSGGATAGAVLDWVSVYTEETNAGAYIPAANMIDSPLLVPANTGIRVVQSSVASVGNIGFNVLVNLTAK